MELMQGWKPLFLCAGAQECHEGSVGGWIPWVATREAPSWTAEKALRNSREQCRTRSLARAANV